MTTTNLLTEDIELAELSSLFCKNQKSFHLYIANYAASNSNNNDNETAAKPLRLHKVENMVDCVFSPNMYWSFYNTILDTDICSTMKDHHYNNNDKLMEQILSLTSSYKCPVRALVKPTAINTENLLKRYGFIELPNRNDSFQYIDLLDENNVSKSMNVNPCIKIYELDDSTQDDCRMRKSEWGYVLCSSFGFRNPELYGTFYADVWQRVEVGPTKPIRMFIAIKNNRVIGGCHVSLACGVACLFNVTTLKDERGQGVGAGLSIAAIQSAKELNYRYMVLQASNMGSIVYKKLGFKSIPPYKMFIKISTIAWYFKIIETLLIIFGVERIQRFITAIQKLLSNRFTILLIIIMIIGIFIAILFR